MALLIQRDTIRMFSFVVALFVIVVPIEGMKISGRMNDIYPTTVHEPWEHHAMFLGKFGVRKNSPLFVYGKVEDRSPSSLQKSESSSMILVVAPVEKWKEFINVSETSVKNHEFTGHSCVASLLVPFYKCTDQSSLYYRSVPCDNICFNQPQSRLPKNSSFIFRVESTRTEFYYVFFVFCAFNISGNCDLDSSKHVNFNYDIHITTDPYKSKPNPFTFQFPANLEGALISYLIFFLFYLILIPTHLILNIKRCTKKLRKAHILVWIFTAAMVLEGVNIFFGLIHYGAYSNTGQGVPALFYMKDFFNLVGNWFLILVLILVAGGWQVTLKSIKWKYASFPIWAIYILFSLIYYIYEIVYYETMPWELNDPLQTWAGGLYLAVRGLVLFYVWYQIYHIYQQEEVTAKLRLYVVLCVIFTIWFWYLPLLVFIVTFTGHVTSSLVIANISTAINLLVNFMMVVLFCPLWSDQYFQFDIQGRPDWYVGPDTSYSKLRMI